MKNYSMLIASLCLFSGMGQAETVSEALKNCGQVQNSLKRLVCYDKLVNDMNRYGGLDDLMSLPAPLPANNSASSSSTAPQNNQGEAARQQDSATSGFGLPQAPADTEEKIYAKVVSIEKDRRDTRTFTLDNGHVWRQTEGNASIIKEGDLVYVESGALGSFHMSKDDVNRRFRVKRIK